MRTVPNLQACFLIEEFKHGTSTYLNEFDLAERCANSTSDYPLEDLLGDWRQYHEISGAISITFNRRELLGIEFCGDLYFEMDNLCREIERALGDKPLREMFFSWGGCYLQFEEIGNHIRMTRRSDKIMTVNLPTDAFIREVGLMSMRFFRACRRWDGLNEETIWRQLRQNHSQRYLKIVGEDNIAKIIFGDLVEVLLMGNC